MVVTWTPTECHRLWVWLWPCGSAKVWDCYWGSDGDQPQDRAATYCAFAVFGQRQFGFFATSFVAQNLLNFFRCKRMQMATMSKNLWHTHGCYMDAHWIPPLMSVIVTVRLGKSSRLSLGFGWRSTTGSGSQILRLCSVWTMAIWIDMSCAKNILCFQKLVVVWATCACVCLLFLMMWVHWWGGGEAIAGQEGKELFCAVCCSSQHFVLHLPFGGTHHPIGKTFLEFFNFFAFNQTLVV